MVKVQYGAMITELKGSMGGTTFQSSRYGFSARNKPIAPRTRTEGRQTIRGLFASASQAWQTMTQVQRDAWEAATASWPHTNKFGVPVTLTGFNLFVMVSSNLQIAGQAINLTASAPAVMTNFTTADLTVDVSLGTMVLVFTATPTPAGQATLVSMSPAMSPGRQALPSEMKTVQLLAGATASPVDLTAAWVKQFGTFPVADRKIFFQLTPIDTTNGTLGVPYVDYIISIP